LHPPNQLHSATAYTRIKHFRPVSQTLTAKFPRPLHKNQTNTDSTLCL
jgi:hypothetical protein